MVKAQSSCTAKSSKAKKDKARKEKRVGVKKSREKKKKELERKKKKKTRVNGRRKKLLGVTDGDALDCCVLLTRLEEKGVVTKVKDTPKTRKHKSAQIKTKMHSGVPKPRTKCDLSGQKKTPRANQKALEPKINQSDALLVFSTPEPRRRRMASLNAEAVNTLLLYRDDPLSVAKKRQLPNDNPAQVGLAKKRAEYAHKDKGYKTQKTAQGWKAEQKARQKKQSKRSVREDQSIDWLSLFAPTPRRQAGLTAATLLKLTSAQYGSKRQKKKEAKQDSDSEAATQDHTQSKADCGEKTQSKTKTKHVEQLKHRKQRRRDVPCQLGPAPQGSPLCKAQTLAPDWRTGDCLKTSQHHGSTVGFSLKAVKEEQLESQVSSCYCCTQERCVQYCHRLALFLGDKSFKEREDGSLSSVFHHHHHHHHLPTLGTHSYTCFPGYYVHYSHPTDSSQTLSLSPRGSKRAKLLGSRRAEPSGISHPVYCCTSVEPCYADACTISGFSAYTSVIPAISHTDCTKCNHTVKREEYSSELNDHHSPSSIPICPSPRVFTGCPVPTVPAADQSVPHIQTPLSDPSQPQAPLQVAKECPQSSKPPSGSRSGIRGSGSISSALNRDNKRLLSAASGGHTVTKQLKKWRKKNTNGWQPVGLPYQKEVFSVDKETPVLRTCFEGVQRDGDVIRVRDTVLLKSGPRKKSLPYVAKVSALWEDPESGELMMSLFWYYRPEHTQGGHNPNIHCENEVFASRHQDVNSVACIEDKCYVLTLAQYCRFCALVKRHREGVGNSAPSLVVPPAVDHTMPTHHCVPDDVDPELVFFCRHVYDFRYGRLLKNLQ